MSEKANKTEIEESALQKRTKLQNQIWSIADEVRGSIDGWDFKQYVLGTLFYRFISEDFVENLGAGGADYADLKDNDKKFTPDVIKRIIIKEGYFIYPSQLFENIVKNVDTNENLNVDLKTIFDSIEASALGFNSEKNIKGLFADFDTTSNRLGNSVEDKNRRLAKVLKGINNLDLGNFKKSDIDIFGDAYEFLISNYAANAGKSGGEFFTPQSVSKLIAQIATDGKQEIDTVYDPACGSGSLLLQVQKQQGKDLDFYGQEINHTTYNLARMNMFLHGINYDDFHIKLGDTLINPDDDIKNKQFDAIVSNPPYSINWVGKDDPTLINDERYSPAGVLAPKSKADFAFVLHSLHHLSPQGRGAIICFPGIFYRGGAEQKIRKYLVEQGSVEAVISLPPNLFYGTSIAVNILVISKGRKGNGVKFIDASTEEFFSKETNNNVLKEKHIKEIMRLLEKEEAEEHKLTLASLKEIEENDFNLSVSSYVEPKNTKEKIDIKELNSQIEATVSKITTLRADIEQIVNEIES